MIVTYIDVPISTGIQFASFIKPTVKKLDGRAGTSVYEASYREDCPVCCWVVCRVGKYTSRGF